MGGKTRKTGIDILGDVPWGTHFCQFYKTKEDLIDILVPYFKAGLENNEFCMWITSEPLSEKEAKEAMRKALPDFDRYLKREQIEILPHEEWYLKKGTFNTQRVLKGWVDKLDQALAQDYDGLRLTGNTFWLEKKDWRNFTEYEKEMNKVIGKYRMMTICSYSLDKCEASEVIDVVSNHQFALIRKEGKWATIESSEHIQMEQSLRKGEENYRQLTESISDVFFEMDKDLICTYWNRASEKLTGISTKDAIGKSLSELFPDTLNTKKTERVYLDVLRTQQPQIFINEYIFGGKDFFFDISVYPSKRGLSVFAKDITERMQAEEELREKEEFNFALFQHNPIQTIVVDRGGRVLKANMAKRKSGDRLPNIGDAMYKDYAAKHEIDMHAELIECIRSDKKKRFPALKYGDKFLDITLAPFPQGAIITSQDITERKRAEEAVKESEERYRGLFNLISDAVYVIDQETGRVLDVNETACKMYGYTREEWLKMQNTDVSAEPAETRKATKDSPETIPIRYHKKKDGTVFPLEMTLNIIDLKGRKAIIATARDITERKKMEEEKDKLLKTIETTKEAINITTPDTIMIYTNDAMDELFGYKKGELTGKHISVLNAGLLRKTKKTPEHVKDAIKKKGVWEGEIHNKRKDGTEFICFAKVSALTDENGKIINYVASQHNITERKRAEEALRVSEERYRAIFNQAADSIVLVEPETGALAEFNERAHENLGYTRKEFKKLRIHDFEIIESAEKGAKHIKKIIREGSDTFETKHRTKGGEIQDILVSSRAISIEGRDFVQSIWSDITERKRAEGALRKSENRLKSLFETMVEGVVLIDADGQIIQANPEAERIAGLKRSDIEGHAYDSPEWNLLRPDGTAMQPKEMAGPRTLKEKRPIKDMVMGVKKPDGNISWININTSLLKKETGKIDGVVLTFADITERKLREEEIKNSQLQLRNLAAHLQSVREEERTHIAREMHDELGQALTAMKMDLSWLGKRLPKDQKPLFEKIKSMSKLADATLQTVKKISTELRPGLLDDLGLTAAIEWQAEEFQTRTGIKCAITTDPEDIILDKDRSTAIFRIFQETLTNVARHAKATKVKVSLKEKAGKVELKVRDNGKGITEKQVSNPRSFGLIGIKERAHYLNGKVVIKGLQDKGTTLTVRIPLPKKGKTK